MSAREFVDTNTLIYAHDRRDAQKRTRACGLIDRLLRQRRGVVSLQVLQEFFSVATRKLGMPSQEARAHVVRYTHFNVVTLGVPDVVAAIDLHRLHGWSIWDALIVRAALNGGCRTLYTEDLQDGYTVDGLTVRNPFAAGSFS